MNAMQKLAWYNLAVIAVTLLCVLCLYPVLHQGATGAFGLLGLLGLGVFLHRRKAGEVVHDERDAQIAHRALLTALGLAGMILLALTVLACLHYEAAGAVPLAVVQWVLWGGVTLFLATQSLAVLVLYRRGG
jgi:hypothetical protein